MKPVLVMAARMRSLLSFTAGSGSPTVEYTGRPAERSTSTSTGYASTPSTAAEFVLDSMRILRTERIYDES